MNRKLIIPRGLKSIESIEDISVFSVGGSCNWEECGNCILKFSKDECHKHKAVAEIHTFITILAELSIITKGQALEFTLEIS